MYIKISPKLRREISKYTFPDYMNDFKDGTPDKYKELTGKRVSLKEIKAYRKSKEIVNPIVDASTVD